jgi:NAD-dependent dihydropyrimidine dehydrogenase PreA subunit
MWRIKSLPACGRRDRRTHKRARGLLPIITRIARVLIISHRYAVCASESSKLCGNKVCGACTRAHPGDGPRSAHVMPGDKVIACSLIWNDVYMSVCKTMMYDVCACGVLNGCTGDQMAHSVISVCPYYTTHTRARRHFVRTIMRRMHLVGEWGARWSLCTNMVRNRAQAKAPIFMPTHCVHSAA